jgi:Protein of unknown function (DUF4232)
MKRLALTPLLLTVLLAACGSSSRSPRASASSTTGAVKPTSSTSTTTTSSTSATAARTTDTSPATATSTAITATSTTTTMAAAPASGPPLCRAAGLGLSFLGQQGGMGQGEIGFVLHNVSRASCHTYGYPGVLFLDRAGRPLPTIPTHTTSDFFGQSPKVPLVVPPGGSFSFRLAVTHGVASSAGCTTAYGLQVIPPNDTATLRTTIPEGAYECRTANVSPVRAGESAYP